MKTNLFKTIALSVMALFFLAPSHIKAQVANPYRIVNNTPCKIDVQYEFFEKNVQTGMCTMICSAGVISVPPSPPVTIIPYPATCVACAVRITIFQINGVAVTPPIVAAYNFPPTPPNAGGPDPSGCSPTGNVRLSVMPGGAQITP